MSSSEAILLLVNAQGEAILGLARRRGLLDDTRLKSARKLDGDGEQIRAGLESLGIDGRALGKLMRELSGKIFRCERCNAEFSFEALASLAGLACGRCSVPLSASERSEAKRTDSKKNSKLTTSRSRLAQAKEIGPYRIAKLIGKGASGVVHLARKEGLDRDFAIKILTTNTFEDQLALERFRREAHIASRLQHPGIVSVVDVGESDGSHYYVMEYVKGETLQAHLAQRAPLPPEEAAALVADLARAAHFAHEHDIVHRDLKPANVILDEKTGKPRITDFGLARDARDHRVTRTGDILGTPYYMAPEQFTGETKIDGRTDIWALGVILFEALTGERPFEAKTSAMLASVVLTGEIRAPSDVVPTVPPALDAICRRCLSRNVPLRYPTAAELAKDLDAFRKGKRVAATPETKVEKVVRKGKRHVGAKELVIGGLVLGALGGALVPLVLGRLSKPPEAPVASDEVERLLDANASLVKVRLELEKRKAPLAPPLAERWAERLLRGGCYADALQQAVALEGDAACAESASRVAAEAAAKLGDLPQATERLAKLAATDPRASARRLFFARKYDEAAKAALRAIAAHPTDAGARRTAAVALLRTPEAASMAARALKFAEEARELEPQEPDSHVVFAYAARAAGRPLAEVDAALDQAFALTAPEPPDPLASITRAWLALQRRDAKGAAKVLEAQQLRGSEELEVLALRSWARFNSEQDDWLEPRTRARGAPAFEATLDELARLIRGPARAEVSLEARDRLERLLDPVDAEARAAVRRALLAGFEGAPWDASEAWWKLARALSPGCPKTAVLYVRALIGRERTAPAFAAIEAARKVAGVDAKELDRLEADAHWRMGHVARASELWAPLAREPGFIGDYARGCLLLHRITPRHAGPLEMNSYFAKAIERTPDRAELYRLHAHGLLLVNTLAKEKEKTPAVASAHRAVELDGAFDVESLFLDEFGPWSIRAGDDQFAPTDEFNDRTAALGERYAALAPDTARFAYSFYRVAMKWPVASSRCLKFLEDAAKRDTRPWKMLGHAWRPLRDGVGNQAHGRPYEAEADELEKDLLEVRHADGDFWIPPAMLDRLEREWKRALPEELRNKPLRAP